MEVDDEQEDTAVTDENATSIARTKVRHRAGNKERPDQVQAPGVTVHRADISGNAQAQFGDRYEFGTTKQYHQHEEHYHVVPTSPQNESSIRTQARNFGTWVAATWVGNLSLPFVKTVLKLISEAMHTGRTLIEHKADQLMSSLHGSAPQEAWREICDFLCSDPKLGAPLCAAISCPLCAGLLADPKPTLTVFLWQVYLGWGPSIVTFVVTRLARNYQTVFFLLQAIISTCVTGIFLFDFRHNLERPRISRIISLSLSGLLGLCIRIYMSSFPAGGPRVLDLRFEVSSTIYLSCVLATKAVPEQLSMMTWTIASWTMLLLYIKRQMQIRGRAATKSN